MKKTGIIILWIMISVILFTVLCIGTSAQTKAECRTTDSESVSVAETANPETDSSLITAKNKTGLLLVFSSEMLLALGIICAAVIVKRLEQ